MAVVVGLGLVSYPLGAVGSETYPLLLPPPPLPLKFTLFTFSHLNTFVLLSSITLLTRPLSSFVSDFESWHTFFSF